MAPAQTISEQLASIVSRKISDSDREQAALLLLDWTGCAVAGQSEPAGQKIRAAFPEETGRSRVLGEESASVS